jgi:8-oxo-dGTP pyrophosphatase MutT (NUDIX family)
MSVVVPQFISCDRCDRRARAEDSGAWLANFSDGTLTGFTCDECLTSSEALAAAVREAMEELGYDPGGRVYARAKVAS